MIKEKKTLLFHRLFWLAAFIICTALLINGLQSLEWNVGLLLLPETLTGTALVYSLLLSCNQYQYNGQNIIVYSGWFHHYITVDGSLKDEHNTFIGDNPILLSVRLDSGEELEVLISTIHRITLKIDGKYQSHI